MRVISFAERNQNPPAQEVLTIKEVKYKEDVVFEDGIAKAVLVEDTSEEFLDVHFRDFSLTTMIKTGDVSRLKFVAPRSSGSLDMIDNCALDGAAISSQIDSLEKQAAAAAAASATEKSDPNKDIV